jgi:hypothetical protein
MVELIKKRGFLERTYNGRIKQNKAKGDDLRNEVSAPSALGYFVSVRFL